MLLCFQRDGAVVPKREYFMHAKSGIILNVLVFAAMREY
jgi:hypothetical protein